MVFIDFEGRDERVLYLAAISILYVLAVLELVLTYQCIHWFRGEGERKFFLTAISILYWLAVLHLVLTYQRVFIALESWEKRGLYLAAI